MSSDDWFLSIDFGTSNTAAAHSAALSGAIESLSLSHAGNLMPSGVFVDAPDRIAVGEHAANEAQRNPAAYIPAPKRLVGQPSVAVNGFIVPTSAPIAAVLRTVFSRAVALHAGQMPAHLVLTHPEAWSPSQIRTLTDAATVAGMRPDAITTVSEPRAAAAHYARSNRLADGAKIAVFDFGGGTLDVAVLSKNTGGTFTVLAARGDNGLGGKNFDALIRQWVDEQLEARNPDLLEYLRRDAPVGIRHQLDDSIRRAKELLSETPSATITAAGGGFHETFQLTRDEFDELISAPIGVALSLTRSAFADAGITRRDQLSALYLTGGTSRIPLVHRALQDIGPVATLDDPKTVVAQGALSSWLASSPQRPHIPGADSVMGDRFPTSPTDQLGGRPTAPTGPTVRAPQGWSDAGADSSAPTTPGRRRRGPLIAAAAAVVVVVAAGAIAAVTLSGGGDDSPEAQPSASAPASSGAAVSLATTQEQVLAAMPATLADQLTRCQNSSFTENQGVVVRCYFKPGASVVAGLAATDASDDPYVTLSVDELAARKVVVANRQGNFDGTATLVENAAKTASASIEELSGSKDYTVTYADNTKFLMVKAWNLAGVDQGKTFLSRSGLIS
ncbi:Hsp70 family protein [Williamsia phyllosphaerae]|uniref:Molecular chaperone DnaK n=1 Tax=Williamsia phyllosphaerae TaxID=885042 RepID=A0ABQ1U1L9_9NOCA|nr:Hsp70 family protein [Williamsia phyllosphaerae]GGF08215.1 molecular chaperone DnaK [Williamsia phyllosphaerae]